MNLDRKAFSLPLFYGPRIKHSSLRKVYGNMNKKGICSGHEIALKLHSFDMPVLPLRNRLKSA